jgi:hypothetical protein
MVTTVPSENEFRDVTSEWFRSRGFRIEKVSEDGDEERADMLIFDDSVRVLLELKIKAENEAEADERDSVLNSGGIHRYSESSLRRNRMSALISKAVSQLMTTPIERDFNVLWLHGAGRYADHHGTRFIASLYGRRWLIAVSEQGGRYCYYFDNSDFFRHRMALCAAIVSWGDEGLLCINDLHADASRFGESSFRAIFGKSCIDPPRAESNGEAYIAPADAERGNVDAMLKAVATKYNVPRLIDSTPTMHIAEAVIGDGGKWPSGSS